MSKSKQSVKEKHLKESLSKLYQVSQDNIRNIEWSESKGAAAEDGFTTELVAVNGKAEIDRIDQEFSFMVKLTPEIGFRAEMVKEVSYK